MPPVIIARLYFTEDDNGNAQDADWVITYLRRMPADLAELAIEHGSPVLANHLKTSARAYGSARLTSVSLRMIERAAVLATRHPVDMWFRPLVALRLKGEGIRTLSDFVSCFDRRGSS